MQIKFVLAEKFMRNAFLFPGQGSQSIGMGKELYESLPEAKKILNSACEVLDYDLKKIMFDGPKEKLTNTRYAQPAIYTCSAMYLEKARQQKLDFSYVAGHSLGEYSALYAAGIFSFADGLCLVDKRGQAMASENGKGIMAAVMGLTEKELMAVIANQEDVVIANLNTKTQIVISGRESDVDAVIEKLNDRESVITKKLAVSGAFHSPQMKRVAKVIESEIEKIKMNEPKAWVVSNVTGDFTKDLTEIKSNLIAQITGQVRWYASVIALKEAGVEQFYECGNGKVLRKLNKVITLKPKCFSV